MLCCVERRRAGWRRNHVDLRRRAHLDSPFSSARGLQGCLEWQYSAGFHAPDGGWPCFGSLAGETPSNGSLAIRPCWWGTPRSRSKQRCWSCSNQQPTATRWWDSPASHQKPNPCLMGVLHEPSTGSLESLRHASLTTSMWRVHHNKNTTSRHARLAICFPRTGLGSSLVGNMPPSSGLGTNA